MNILLCLVICAVSVCADDTEERRSKLPYIADAAGNSIPRPYNVPASVGSPVNLLTPDRYEFYTFDESGELVKRLMTLEEIQAIVAAGDDADGLVTFANENQPTIAFNFSQPPYTKVNSVVTNVQNVLKAQMEAHKNNPQMQPTFDTPDVSDSWSLILPSIFGNTGVDIVPDKTSGSFITPETETIEVDNLNGDYLYTFSKESNSQSQLPSSVKPIDLNTKTSSTTDTKTTKPTSIRSTTRPNTVRIEPKPLTMKPSTPAFKVTTEKIKMPITTIKPVTLNSTTMKIHVTSISSLQRYTQKPDVERTTILQVDKHNMNNQNNMQVDSNENIKQTTKKLIQTTTEKLENTYVPVSTVSYISQINISKPTSRPIQPTISTTTVSDINSILSENVEENNVTKTLPHSPLLNSTFSNKDEEYYKTNITTITTQSVSPETVPSSTEVSSEKYHQLSSINDGQTPNDDNIMEEEPPIISLFDVAQSFSQIASDLGSNFAPIPTASNVLDTTKQNNIDMESKENVEIDIPQEMEKANVENQGYNNSSDNYVKVITLDVNKKNNDTKIEESIEKIDNSSSMYEKITSVPETFTQTEITTASDFMETTTLDLILSDSMDDVLSQVVYQTNNIVSDPKVIDKTNDSNMPEKDIPTSTDISEEHTTTTEAPLEISTTTAIEKIGNNNEQIISLKSEGNITTPVTIISTTERFYKNDDIPEYVPISLPTYKNITKSELPKISEDEKNNDSIKLTAEIHQYDYLNKKNEIGSQNYTPSKYNIETTTQIETTTVAFIKNDFALVKENKFNSGDINKVNNINNDKISGILPKIDEFKKKIQKINIDDKELANERNSSWKLIPTVPPPKAHSEMNQNYKPEGFYTPESNSNKHITLDFSKENQGLEVTTKDLSEDIAQFVELCNELSFQYWNDVTEDKDKKRSFVLSPYAITSMLAMMFMGARGATSGEMNEILKLDDMVTFNPHFILKNISDSIDISPASGVAVSAFIRELYSDRSKGKILTFYKERAQQFYNGHVEEINFKLISDVIRRRTNLLVKRYTFGKITEYMKTNAIVMQPPLAAFSMNIFETDCTGSSVDGRDGEMYFVVSPNVRQRRLVPVPAVVYRTNFLAGYDPVLDATAAALGNTNSVISTLFLMPGQQGNIVHGEDLEALEKRLLASNPAQAWNRLLRTLLPRVGLELQIPRFSHKSIFNISSSLRKMGLKDLFNQEHADLGGLNGPSKNLYLSDMVQLTSFVTCGESVVSEQHHIEEYPESLEVEKIQRRRSARWLNWDEPRDYQRAFHDPHDVGEAMHLPLHLRPRQARLPARNTQPARLKFDRPFLFFVRHNPSGMILYVGRYNPRLLP